MSLELSKHPRWSLAVPVIPDRETKNIDAEKKFAKRAVIGSYLRAISVIINSLYVNDSRETFRL